MVRRNKTTEKKLRHNCSSCQSTYTLLETHLTRKDNHSCSTNCQKVWQTILNKYCQEKVLGAELEQEQKENKENHGSN